MVYNISSLLFSMLCATSSALLRCSQVGQRTVPEFQLIRSCVRSSATVLASDYLSSVRECAEFTVFHRGLAFNFVSPKDLQDDYRDTCLVYDCPETDPYQLNAYSLYDYYGIYTDVGIERNMSCVPKVGMFQLHQEEANYTEARDTCEWEGGRLARITSSERTNHLATLVATLGSSRKLHIAYTGLDDRDQEGHFVSSADEPLECFEYRAWAPGEPRARRQSEDCVVLDSRRGWRVKDCRSKRPFLCEMLAVVSDPCAHVKSYKFKRRCLAEAKVNKNKNRKNFQKCTKNEDYSDYNDPE